MEILQIVLDKFTNNESIDIGLFSMTALLHAPCYKNDELIIKSNIEEIWYLGSAYEGIDKLPRWSHNKKVINFYYTPYMGTNKKIFFIIFEE